MVSLGSGLAAVFAARTVRSLRRGAPVALLGAGLAYRGLRRRRATQALHATDSTLFESERTRTVMRTAPDLREMWRRPEVLADVWSDDCDLRPGEGRSLRWSLRLPAGPSLEFRAELVESEPDSVVWRAALPEARNDAMGRGHDAIRVTFRPAPGDKGTEVTLHLAVVPPGGRAGAALLRALERGVDFLLDRVLRRFENLAEAGEIATLENNPSARVRMLSREQRRVPAAHQARGEV